MKRSSLVLAGLGLVCIVCVGCASNGSSAADERAPRSPLVLYAGDSLGGRIFRQDMPSGPSGASSRARATTASAQIRDGN
jgi:hypothetical protein